MKGSKAEELKMKEIAKSTGLSLDTVKAILDSPYEFIRETTGKMEINRDLSVEEFNELKTNFNIPCIGKLYASSYMYRRINKLNGKESNKDK